ncbi:hypothetical protein DFH06DRAFT_1230988 [Mycena polygramma]|nr:hypothetical protein DFH06DRAFT_1230988 [Mycena polygramma]
MAALLANAVEVSLLAHIRSADFTYPSIPALSDEYWSSVTSFQIPAGCVSSPFDVYTEQGKRIYSNVITSCLDMEQLVKFPATFLLFAEKALGSNAILYELFKRITYQTVKDNTLVVRDGFFAFVAAHWNQKRADQEITQSWLVCLIGPLMQVISASYQENSKMKGPSRNKRNEPQGVQFLWNLYHVQKSSEDDDAWFHAINDSTSTTSSELSAEIPSPMVPQANVSSPAPIPSYGQWVLSPLAPEVRNQLGTLVPLTPPSPALPGLAEYQRVSKLFWAPDLPGASGVDDELGAGLESGYSASLLPGFELDLSKRMAALNFSSSKAMLEKDPWASPNNGLAFRTPSPPGPPVFWADRLRLLDRVSPDPKEETVLEKVSEEILTRESAVPQVVISTPVSGDAVRRPLTPHNSPHTCNTAKEEKGKGREVFGV